MPTGSVSYPGVLAYREVEYAQTLGVDPDAIALRIVPQGASIANIGDLTFSYTGQASITLPNCTVDAAQTTFNVHGRTTSIVLYDRRQLWKYAEPISGRYNTIRNGSRIASTQKSLRELVTILLNAMGEYSVNVIAVSASIYPDVNWYCDEPVEKLAELLNEWGYVLSLGFGAEPVTIYQNGTGAVLPTNNVMMDTSGVDATIQPRTLRVCFAPSVIQARLELEAVGLDTDGSFKEIENLSYKPAAGWAKTDPKTFYSVAIEYGATEEELALRTVFRCYRIKAFSDGTLTVPVPGGATLNSISQIFPVQNRRLDLEESDTGEFIRARARVFGQMWPNDDVAGQPRELDNTPINLELPVKFRIDGERGLVWFEEPIYKVGTDFEKTTLYLETAFHVRHNTHHQWAGYHRDISFDPLGYGFSTIEWHLERHEITVSYDSNHASTGTTDNSEALNDTAASLVAAAAGKFTQKASKTIVYQRPFLNLRCNGLVQQVKHVFSDGEENPGFISIASEGMTFDRYVKDGTAKAIQTSERRKFHRAAQNRVIRQRPLEAND